MLALPLVLVLAATAPGTHGRLQLGISAGGGWASDVFVGAGEGAGPVVQAAPGARLDLSLSPSWKLDATAELAWTRFFSEPFTTTGGTAAVEARLLGEVLQLPGELAVGAGGEHTAYSEPAPLGGHAAAPDVTATTAGAITVAGLLHAGPVALRASASAGPRTSRVPGGADVDARELDAGGGASWSVGDRVVLSADARFAHAASADPAFAWSAGWGGAGVEGRVAGALTLRATAALERTRYDDGGLETLSRAALEAVQPFGPVAIFASWAGTWSSASGGRLGEATLSRDRQVLFLGVRGRARVLEW